MKVSTCSYSSLFVRRRAFTLVELLVVIVIIVSLASISFVVATKTRNSTDKVQCTANLKELHTAALAYSHDHYGRLPSNGLDDDPETSLDESEGWYVAVAPYLYGDMSTTKVARLDGKFRCTADERMRAYKSKDLKEASPETVSYVPWTDGSDVLEDVESPINISRGYAQDSVPWISDGIAIPTNKNVTKASDFEEYVLPAAERHDNSINVIYANGSIKTILSPTFMTTGEGVALKEHLKR